MIRGLAVLLCVLMVSVVVLPSAHAASHRTALKGQEVKRSILISGQTGACVCLEQWYTVGFKKGPVTLKGQLQACGDQGHPYCMMVVSLLRGDETLKTVAAQCPSKAKHCNRAWSIHYRVRSPGAYYVQVRGEIGLTMNFTMRPTGHIYRLHCGKYC
jgi:hypothetical protein